MEFLNYNNSISFYSLFLRISNERMHLHPFVNSVIMEDLFRIWNESILVKVHSKILKNEQVPSIISFNWGRSLI